MHALAITLLLASAATTSLAARSAGCLNALSAAGTFKVACESYWPLKDLTTLSTTLPPFCNTSGTCTATAALSLVTEVATQCTDLTDVERDVTLSVTVQAKLSCFKSDTDGLCLLRSVDVFNAVKPLVENFDTFNKTKLLQVLNDRCSQDCIDKSYALSVALRPFNPKGADAILVPAFACVKEGENFCFAEIADLVAQLKAGHRDLSMLQKFCSPCGRRVVSILRRLNVSVPLPEWSRVCYVDHNKTQCLKTTIDAAIASDVLNKCNKTKIGYTDAACAVAYYQFSQLAGCCAHVLVPLVKPYAPLLAAKLDQVLDAECAIPGAPMRALIRLVLSNVNWARVKLAWSLLKDKIRAELAFSLGIEIADVFSVTIETSTTKRAGSTTLLFDIRPSSTAMDANTIETNAGAAITANELQFVSLNSAAYVQDPTSPVLVTGGVATTEAAPNSAPRSAVAMGTAVAVALAMVLN